MVFLLHDTHLVSQFLFITVRKLHTIKVWSNIKAVDLVYLVNLRTSCFQPQIAKNIRTFSLAPKLDVLKKSVLSNEQSPETNFKRSQTEEGLWPKRLWFFPKMTLWPLSTLSVFNIYFVLNVKIVWAACQTPSTQTNPQYTNKKESNSWLEARWNPVWNCSWCFFS